MKKSNKKFDIAVVSYGIYTKWDKKSKLLPDIVKFTNEIPACPETEFGMCVHIKRGKGVKLVYFITHPPFRDDKGRIEPEFSGEHMVGTNDYRFFIGDSIWEPVDDKKGEWIISLFYHERLIAMQKFIII